RDAMEEYQRTNQNDNLVEPSRRQATPLSVFVTLFILAAAGVVLGMYVCQQKRVIGKIAAHEADLNATIAQLHSQLQDATATRNDVAAVQAAEESAAAKTAQLDARAAAESSAEAARLRRLQAAISDQQKRLQAMQAEVAKTRSDLEGNLNFTRNELNGSIARNHRELVV